MLPFCMSYNGKQAANQFIVSGIGEMLQCK